MNTLSLVVPFYNEKKIVTTYKKLTDFLRKNIPSYELILVSDGSKSEYIQNLKTHIKEDKKTHLISYKRNQGRGFAVTQGFKKAKGKYVAYIDADLEINPLYLKKIYRLLNQYELVTMTKYHPKAEVNSPPLRKISSYLFNLYVKILLGSKVSDHQIGLKGFHNSIIKAALPHITEKGWLFDVEILHILQKKGVTIAEVPIKLRYGYSKIRKSFIYDFLRLYLFVFLIKVRHFNKKYHMNLNPRAKKVSQSALVGKV